jgi:hypothetical protein
MDEIIKVFASPPPKTLGEQCVDYVVQNPGTVAKGAAAGVVLWYGMPVIIGTVTILPWVGAGWYLYNYGSQAGGIVKEIKKWT